MLLRPRLSDHGLLIVSDLRSHRQIITASSREDTQLQVTFKEQRPFLLIHYDLIILWRQPLFSALPKGPEAIDVRSDLSLNRRYRFSGFSVIAVRV